MGNSPQTSHETGPAWQHVGDTRPTFHIRRVTLSGWLYHQAGYGFTDKSNSTQQQQQIIYHRYIGV